MLQLSNLQTGYKGRTVGRGLNASLPQGSLTALLGINGVGKSTLLRTIAGFIPPLSGRVTINGTSVVDYSPRQLARTLGVVLTHRPPDSHITADEVVGAGRLPYARFLGLNDNNDREVVRRAMQLTGTEDFCGRPLRSLSDGEQQRVFIAKALAQQTPVILLDEPTAFLDFPTKAATLRLLSRLAHNEGRTLLFSTHDVELALHFADRLWLLQPDGIVDGTPKALAAEGFVGQFFAKEGISFNAERMQFRYNTSEETHKQQ